MKFKWKVVVMSSVLIVCVYLSLQQAYGIDNDNDVQPREHKSGEEKNYVAKPTGTPSAQIQIVTKLNNSRTNSPTSFLNSAKRVLPWIDRKVFLPNYFTSNLTEVEKGIYKKSVIVYLHHNKAAGTTTKKCMMQVIPKSGRKLGPTLSSQTRLVVSKRLNSPSYRDSYNAYMGGYSFGLCDEIKKPCSYFTIFRDPYHRSISSFSYCRRSGHDQLCTAHSPWKVTLKEWTIHQGSFLFRQMLFHPKFCSDFVNNFKMSLPKVPHNIHGAMPCWFRQKVIMLDLLSKPQMDALVDFCVDNIERWFAVVGLTDEYDTSLAMLQHVYGVKFSSCTGSVKNSSGSYQNISNNTTVSEGYAQMVDDLMNDEMVQRALYADVRLYNKIKEIFIKQKEKMNLNERI